MIVCVSLYVCECMYCVCLCGVVCVCMYVCVKTYMLCVFVLNKMC